jgi:hypothetical protein
VTPPGSAIDARTTRRELYARQIATQRADYGASGVDQSEGSALDLARVRYQGEIRSTSAAAGYVQSGARLLNAYTTYRKSRPPAADADV